MSRQILDNDGRAVPAFRFGTVHVKAYGAGSAVIDDGISDDVNLVMVWASTDCFIAIGPTPTASPAGFPLTAKVHMPVAVSEGEKIAAIQQTDPGTLYVTELL